MTIKLNAPIADQLPTAWTTGHVMKKSCLKKRAACPQLDRNI